MAELLFDPASVPADVLSQDGVTEVNTLIEKLRSRLVDRVQMQEPGSGFRVSNMARVYSQAHLRRCLQLIEAAHDLVYTGRGLAALTLVRSLYETVANYVAVSQQLVELIEANAPLQEIHNFIHTRAYATRLAGCGKSRDFEKMAMERARYRNEGHIRSMAYGRAPGDEWQRNDDQSTFSASC